MEGLRLKQHKLRHARKTCFKATVFRGQESGGSLCVELCFLNKSKYINFLVKGQI